MRIPGLRTGMMKNPVGFAVRAALNDKSGRKSSSTKSTSSRSRSTSTRRISSSSTSYSRPASSYISPSTSYRPKSSSKPNSKPISYADEEHNYNAFPNVLLDRGIIRTYGYTLDSAKNKAKALAKQHFKVSADYYHMIQLKTSYADSYKFGIEISVDIDRAKKDISLDKSRYTNTRIADVYMEYKCLQFSKYYKQYQSIINSNSKKIETAQRALEVYEESRNRNIKLEEQAQSISEEINRLREGQKKCGFFSFVKKRRFAEEIKRLDDNLNDVKEQIEECRGKLEKISSPDALNTIIQTSTEENTKLKSRIKNVTSSYEKNYVNEEMLYAKILDVYVLSVLLNNEEQKEVLLFDERIRDYINKHPEVYNDVSKPNTYYYDEDGGHEYSSITELLVDSQRSCKETDEKEVHQNTEKYSIKEVQNNTKDPLIKEATPNTDKNEKNGNIKQKSDVDIQLKPTKSIGSKLKPQIAEEQKAKGIESLVQGLNTVSNRDTTEKEEIPNKNAQESNQIKGKNTLKHRRIFTRPQISQLRYRMQKIIDDEYCTQDAYRDMFVCADQDYTNVEKCIVQASGITQDDACKNSREKAMKRYKVRKTEVCAEDMPRKDGRYWAETHVKIEKVINGLERKLSKMSIEEKYSEDRIEQLYEDYLTYNFSIREKQYIDRMDYLKDVIADIRGALKGLKSEQEIAEFNKYLKELQKEKNRINIKYLRCEDDASNEVFRERMYYSISDPIILKTIAEYPDMKEIIINDPIIYNRFKKSLINAKLK